MSSQFHTVRATLRQQAYAQMRAVQSEAFRTLARERGGVNPSNRKTIEEEALRAGQHAAAQVFLAAGYHWCITGCGRVASPNYVLCPSCEDAGGASMGAGLPAHTMTCDNCFNETSWTSNEFATRPNEMWCASCNRKAQKEREANV